MAHERWEVVQVRMNDGAWRRVGPHRTDFEWLPASEFPDSGHGWEPFSATDEAVFYRKYVAFLPHSDDG